MIPIFSFQATVQVSLSTDTIVNYWETYNVLAYTHNHEREDAMIVVSWIYAHCEHMWLLKRQLSCRLGLIWIQFQLGLASTTTGRTATM